ncbi:AAA family ATPase [Deinococcus aestuarii]|uniref:AAA family ATPase n=1 Tax=Deinococcus aestuarii TaxID=2774531 RepID=UPI001C0CA718|nr:AAA family ATPase [Deinococcus aestuarii]
MSVPARPLPHLRAAPPRPPHERLLAELPLTVLVGVTGVGKSTALAALGEANPGLRVLPDRRMVTDHAVIAPLAGGPVSDRAERFRLTALYRERHPGGMAHALGTLSADTRHWGERPLFDGLRGLEEVRHAAEHFPRWRFVALVAPDVVRVRRLLGRADSFDRAAGGEAGKDLRADLATLPGAAAVFTPAELDGLAALVAEGHSPADLLARVRIVVTERAHYDPDAASAFLGTLPPSRALVLDTVALSPAQVAQAVRSWA